MLKIHVENFDDAGDFFRQLARTEADPDGATPKELADLKIAKQGSPKEKLKLLKDNSIEMIGYSEVVFHFDTDQTKHFVVPEHALLEKVPESPPGTTAYPFPPQVEDAYERKICHEPPSMTNKDFYRIRIGDYCTNHCL